MAVHTAQLGLGIDATPGFRYSTLYTVPAGRRTIVKELYVVGIGSGTAVSTVYFSGVFAFTRTHPAGIDLFRIPCWTVLLEGQTIVWARSVDTDGAQEIIVSGTELVL